MTNIDDTFIKCVETGDIQGQLIYWKTRYEDLISQVIPPWIKCREAITNIERLETILDGE